MRSSCGAQAGPKREMLRADGESRSDWLHIDCSAQVRYRCITNYNRMVSTQHQAIQKLLDRAGITINGSNPWDIHVYDERLYNRVLTGGSLALGEAYMDGWWDAPALDQFFTRVFNANISGATFLNFKLILTVAKDLFFNMQDKVKSFEVGEVHYDVGNGLYTHMLGLRMAYTCGYWKEAKTLDESQENKLDLVCRKIGLQPGQRVLDIGCGWGSFLKFAAEKYGVSGVGVTISKEQAELAREACAGLPIEIRLQDYRDVDEKFDHIVSLGMFEHVGYKNYRTYMQVVKRCLKDGGLFLLHTIGGNKTVYGTDAWIRKYIFPNSMLPSIAQIGKSIERLFVMEDWHNFGADYDLTLMEWWKNFDASWPSMSEKYSERFYRMWKFYLLSCAASFRSRRNQLWQIVLSSKGVVGGYESVR